MLPPSDMLGGSRAPRPTKRGRGAGHGGGSDAAGALGLAEPGQGSAGAALGCGCEGTSPAVPAARRHNPGDSDGDELFPGAAALLTA